MFKQEGIGAHLLLFYPDHVLGNLSQDDDPWYYMDEIRYPLRTPEYVFEEGSLMRPVY